MLLALAVRLFCAEPLELIARTIPTARIKLRNCFDLDIANAPDSKFLGLGLQKLAREAARLAHSIGRVNDSIAARRGSTMVSCSTRFVQRKRCDSVSNFDGFSKDFRLWRSDN